MNLSLDNNVNKFVLLVVSGVIVLLAVNMNKKKLGNQVSTLISVLVIGVSGIFGYTLLNQETEQFNVSAYDSLSPVEKHVQHQPVEHFNNLPNNYEYFQDNIEEDVVDQLQEDEADDLIEQVTEEDNIVNDVINELNNSEPEEVYPEEVYPEVIKEPVQDNQITYASAEPNNYVKSLDVTSLLPNGDTQFSNTNPAVNGNLEGQNLLTAGFHVGVNTVGNALRNANLSLRSEPPNPQIKVSPWLNSTIAPDVMRRPLE